MSLSSTVAVFLTIVSTLLYIASAIAFWVSPDKLTAISLCLAAIYLKLPFGASQQ